VVSDGFRWGGFACERFGDTVRNETATAVMLVTVMGRTSFFPSAPAGGTATRRPKDRPGVKSLDLSRGIET
jgi:hypothetical protein